MIWRVFDSPFRGLFNFELDSPNEKLNKNLEKLHCTKSFIIFCKF